MDIRPKLLPISPWDANKGASIYYTYTGSKQTLQNELVVTNTTTDEIVYSFLYTSYEKVHHIPPNVLINGGKYKAKIRVKLSDDTFSQYSNEVSFMTFKTPILDIDNIDGQGYVYNSDVTFIALYSQSDGEMVKTYRFKLYDENEDLMETYPLRIPSDLTNLTETVTGLEKGKAYYIECLIETINGVVYSHRERFIPLYIVPSINGVITTRNDAEEGLIRITSNLKQIIGTQVQSGSKDFMDSNSNSFEQVVHNYQYIDNDWIVIPSNKPIIFRGLGMNRASDFVVKAWCKNIPNNKRFLEISPTMDEGIMIELWKYEDRIVAIKKYEGVTASYRSNIVTIPKDTEFLLYIKAIEHRIDVNIAIL